MNGLDKLFGSKSRVTILTTLFNHMGDGLRINEIVRESGVNPRLVSTEIKKLEELGIVKPNKRGNSTRYTISEESSIKSPLQEIFFKKDWTSWERPARIHHLLITMDAMFGPMHEYFGLHYPQAHLIFEEDVVTWYYPRGRFVELGKLLVPIYQSDKQKIWEDFTTAGENITSYKTYKSFYDNYVRFWRVAYITELISFYIDTLLDSGEHITMDEPSFTDEYEQKIWGLAEQAQRIGIDSIDVSDVVYKYSWIQNSYHSVHKLNEDEVRMEVRKKLGKKQPKSARSKSPTSIPQELVDVGKEIILMNDKRKRYMMIAAQHLYDLLGDIGSKYSLTLDLMVQTLPREVLTINNLGGLREELEKRLHACTIVGSFEEGITVYSGKVILPEGFKQETKETIAGKVGCGGKAVGRAKIVRKVSDINKVHHGDVIVSPMTDPMMTPAIRRCVAIVTDEGGIMCHAAVIAREFNIPCIIATGNATKLIKDKDLIEVDADSGIVRIMEAD
jgi:phosphohistidine swiveling domain-containing protein/DNA-binding transcriptional ArsR family regulator